MNGSGNVLPITVVFLSIFCVLLIGTVGYICFEQSEADEDSYEEGEPQEAQVVKNE